MRLRAPTAEFCSSYLVQYMYRVSLNNDETEPQIGLLEYASKTDGGLQIKEEQ
jgi:hypothetical protein